MTAHSARPPADPFRKARFRDEARRIVTKDRALRKQGFTVDTAGAIASALERAYKCGFEEAHKGTAEAPAQRSEVEALAWELIPPRPRHAFWCCCLHVFGEHGNDASDGYLVSESTERFTPGWKLVVVGRPYLTKDKPYGDKTIAPLVKLGLLATVDSAPERLVLTDRARDTWLLFQARGGRFPESQLMP